MITAITPAEPCPAHAIRDDGTCANCDTREAVPGEVERLRARVAELEGWVAGLERDLCDTIHERDDARTIRDAIEISHDDVVKSFKAAVSHHQARAKYERALAEYEHAPRTIATLRARLRNKTEELAELRWQVRRGHEFADRMGVPRVGRVSCRPYKALDLSMRVWTVYFELLRGNNDE